MIRVNPECYSCFLRQVETACRYGEFGEETTIEILKKASRYISTAKTDQVPVRVASRLHEMVRDTAGVADPFERVKREQKDRFDMLYPMARAQVERSNDQLETALLLSGAGNINDFGIISREEAEHFFPGEGSFRKGIFDVSSLRNALRGGEGQRICSG